LYTLSTSLSLSDVTFTAFIDVSSTHIQIQVHDTLSEIVQVQRTVEKKPTNRRETKGEGGLSVSRHELVLFRKRTLVRRCVNLSAILYYRCTENRQRVCIIAERSDELFSSARRSSPEGIALSPLKCRIPIPPREVLWSETEEPAICQGWRRVGLELS
jgi:hypothetical protein